MRFLQAFILTLLISATAFAQAIGSLRGTVADPNNAVIPNATVVVVSNDGSQKTAVSNNAGEYTVANLPAGIYTVRANVNGFSPFENTQVTVQAGKRTDLTITLEIAVEQQVVTVGDNQNKVTTDPENNADATVLRGKDIESLPEDPDELAAALQALAGASAGPNGGQFYIDGFTGGRLPPREAIREIRINQNPFSSEYDRPGFGRVEIFTKPGVDRFRGQVFFNFNNQELNSRNPFAVNRAKTRTLFGGGNLSGPIIKKKASFFLDVDNRLIDDNAVINAQILDSNLNPALFEQSLVVPRRRFSISPRFDYAINDRNTLIARYSFTRNTVDNSGIGNFSLPTLAFSTRNTEQNVQFTETAILSPTIINETRFQYNRSRNNQNGNNSIPTISVSGAFTGGGSNVGLNFTNEDRYELQNYTTWTLGKHALKFGVRLRSVRDKTRSESNFAGNFVFAGRPAVIDPVSGLVIQPALNSIDQYRLRVSGVVDAQTNPNQFTITTGTPFAGISQTDFGLFLNDDWRVNPKLTLSYGLRYEAQTNVKNNLNFAPRFGFAFSPGAGGAKPPKTVFRGGFGIFYDRISENLSLQEARFNGQNQIQYIVTDPALLSQPVFTLNGASNVPTAAQIAAVVPGSTVVRRLDPDIKSPHTLQSAISVERQLPLRTTVSFTYLWSRSFNLLRQRNINAPVCPLLTVCPTLTADINALRPDPTTGNIYEYESTGRFNQNQFLVNFNSRLNPNFTLFGNYRLARAKSDVEGGGGFGFGGGGAGAGGFPQYSYDLSTEYGDATQDIRHFFVLGGSFGAPFKIRLAPFIIARSGVPFNIVTGVDSNRDSIFAERPTFAQLSDRCQSLGLTNSFCDIGGISNSSTTIIPRNYGRGPSSINVNLNVTKTIGFGTSARNRAAATSGPAQQQPEAPAAGAGRAGNAGNRGGRGGDSGGIPGIGGGGRGGGGGRAGFGQFSGQTDKPYNLTIGLQISNLFNRVNGATPISNLSSPRFGEVNSLGGGFGFGGGDSSAGNRRVVVQLRFSF